MKERTRRAIGWAVGGTAAALAAGVLLRRLQAYDFRGKSIVITGGTRGLGLVMARQLASEGARLTICARDPQEVERAREEFRRRGVDVVAVDCDLTRPEDTDRLVEEAMRRWGRIDVLINNAGVIQTAPMEEMTLDDYRRAMDIHYWAPLRLILAVLPQMRERGEGRVVNITSIGGKISFPHLLPYNASKFALVGLSEGLRAELAKDNIVVTTICPWLMRTGSPRNADFKGKHELEYAWFSVSDSLPLVSLSAEWAAWRIVNACRHGRAELVLGLPAKLAVAFHGILPGPTSRILGWVNRLLPGPGGIGSRSAKGSDSRPRWLPAAATALSSRAAARNNEILGHNGSRPAV